MQMRDEDPAQISGLQRRHGIGARGKRGTAYDTWSRIDEIHGTTHDDGDRRARERAAGPDRSGSAFGVPVPSMTTRVWCAGG